MLHKPKVRGLHTVASCKPGEEFPGIFLPIKVAPAGAFVPRCMQHDMPALDRVHALPPATRRAFPRSSQPLTAGRRPYIRAFIRTFLASRAVSTVPKLHKSPSALTLVIKGRLRPGAFPGASRPIYRRPSNADFSRFHLPRRQFTHPRRLTKGIRAPGAL